MAGLMTLTACGPGDDAPSSGSANGSTSVDGSEAADDPGPSTQGGPDSTGSADAGETGDETSDGSTGGEPVLCPDLGPEAVTQLLADDAALAADSAWLPAGSRDVDGDGFDDLAVYQHDRVLVAHGDFGADVESLQDWVDGGAGFAIEGDGIAQIVSATLVSDVSADGLADIAIFTEEQDCECGRDDGCFGTSIRRMYLVHGKADTAAVSLADVEAGVGGFTAEYDAPFEYCGASERAHAAGDVNGDGLNDIVVEANFDSSILFGKADTAPISLTDPGAAGATVPLFAATGAGDVDGDGVGDLVGYENNDVVVWLGTQGGAPEQGFRVVGSNAANFPKAIGVGDVNGDGLSDIALEDVVLPGVHVVFGKADLETVETSDILAGSGGFSVPMMHRGRVTSAGDMNDDGLLDVAISLGGAPAPNGSIYVVFGKADTASVELCDIAAGLGGFRILGAEGVPIGAGWGLGRRHEGGGTIVTGTGDAILVASAP